MPYVRKSMPPFLGRVGRTGGALELGQQLRTAFSAVQQDDHAFALGGNV
jgi:hypothetical protein